MGGSQTAEQNSLIFMTTNKQLYIAGDYVQGDVYLRIMKASSYTKLIVGLQGLEYVYWIQGHGKSKRTYRNRCLTYDSSFVIGDFKGNAPTGDYTFPFAFLLPGMITGSFFFSKYCYIRYTLRAELLQQSQKQKSKIYSMFLNLLEPPRMPIGPTTTTTSINSKCCQCCADYGTISVTLNSNRNFVMNGDLVQISGVLDNSRGTQIIQSGSIILQRRRIKIYDGGHIANTVEQQFNLYNLTSVQPYNNLQFNFQAKIPQSLVYSTAIGKFIGTYYVIHLYTNYGCFANKAQAQLHIIFHSKTPIIVKPFLIQQPPNWSPQIMPKFVYQDMTSYIYTPNARMPFLNLPNTNIMNHQNLPLDSTRSQANQNLYNKNQIQLMNVTNQTNQSWSQNYVYSGGYQPVFYDQQVINDAQREYMNQNYGE